MKCAMELVATAAIRAEEIEAEKAREILQRKLAMRADTIALCESIGKKLEAMAQNGKCPIFQFALNACNYPLCETHSDYADKRLSYRMNGNPIDLEYLSEWFSQYCFETTNTTDWGYHYGSGYIQIIKVKISPSPECL